VRAILAYFDIEKTVDLLNGIAAVLGLIGAGMLFKFNPPTAQEPGGLAVEDANMDTETAKTYGVLRAEFYQQLGRNLNLSKVGFAFVVGSFAFLLAATLLHAYGR
jgi:hypothetical protein